MALWPFEGLCSWNWRISVKLTHLYWSDAFVLIWRVCVDLARCVDLTHLCWTDSSLEVQLLYGESKFFWIWNLNAYYQRLILLGRDPKSYKISNTFAPENIKDLSNYIYLTTWSLIGKEIWREFRRVRKNVCSNWYVNYIPDTSYNLINERKLSKIFIFFKRIFHGKT